MARIIITFLQNIRAAAAAHYLEARAPRLLDFEDALKRTPENMVPIPQSRGNIKKTVLVKENEAKESAQTPLPLHSAATAGSDVVYFAHQRLNLFS